MQEGCVVDRLCYTGAVVNSGKGTYVVVRLYSGAVVKKYKRIRCRQVVLNRCRCTYCKSDIL